MAQPRTPETDQGIQGAAIVETYDKMQRGLRDKGLLETKEVIANGVTQGLVLELGPGPGYLGLEWLKATKGRASRDSTSAPTWLRSLAAMRANIISRIAPSIVQQRRQHALRRRRF